MNTNHPTIVILGSKPKARIPDADIIVCANYSIVLYADQLSRFSRIINVLSGDELMRIRRDENELYQRVLKSRSDAMVIYTRRDVAQCVETIAADGADMQKVTEIGAAERRSLVWKIAKMRHPIIYRELFMVPFRAQKFFYQRLRANWIAVRKDPNADWAGYFRPSTGVTALIWAISEFGADATYILSGIGMKNRGQNDYKTRQIPREEYLPKHLLADKQVLKKLNRTYRLFATEPELVEACRLQMLPQPL